MMLRAPARFVAAALVFAALAACDADPSFHPSSARGWVPLTPELLTAMQEKGMTKEDPILIRTYKQEGEFEIWKKDQSGRFALLKTFPMCRWSGQLGPKRKEGDRQAPEGYYEITPAQMNPNSNYHLSYDVGYPNAYDRAHGYTGSYLMVHGDCSSAGCYSMTDKQIEEIYALVREAHSGGQKAVQMEAFPFRFTAQNMARHRLDPNMPFWKNLKEGADRFEITKEEPKAGVCNGRYTFDRVSSSGESEGCGKDGNPDLTRQVAEKQQADNAQVAALVAKGAPAVELAYDDGGQNPYFRNRISEESRPEAIAEGPTVELMDAKGQVTNVAVRATGFDDASIAAAVKEIEQPGTQNGTVAVASATKGAPATAASTGTAIVPQGQATTIASTGAPVANATAARRAPGQASDARTTVAAYTEPTTTGSISNAEPATTVATSSNKEEPMYKRLFAKLPFGGTDQPSEQSEVVAQDAAAPVLDPAAPLPPVRPTSLTSKISSRHGAAPQNDIAPAPQADLAPAQKTDSAPAPQATASSGFSLFSSRAILAALPTFSTGAVPAAPTPIGAPTAQ